MPNKGVIARLLRLVAHCEDDWSAIMTRPVIHPIMARAVQAADKRKKKPRPMTTGA